MRGLRLACHLGLHSVEWNRTFNIGKRFYSTRLSPIPELRSRPRASTIILLSGCSRTPSCARQRSREAKPMDDVAIECRYLGASSPPFQIEECAATFAETLR
jgi:hypothetical protein